MARYLSDVLPAQSLILDCSHGDGPDAAYLTKKGHCVLTAAGIDDVPERRFDAVMDVFTLSHVSGERDTYLMQLARAVKPGGLAAFEFRPGDRDCRDNLLACFEVWRIEKAAQTSEPDGVGGRTAEFVVFRKAFIPG